MDTEVKNMRKRILRSIRVDAKEWKRFGELARSLASDRSELIRRAIRSMLRDRRLLSQIIEKGG